MSSSTTRFTTLYIPAQSGLYFITRSDDTSFTGVGGSVGSGSGAVTTLRTAVLDPIFILLFPIVGPSPFAVDRCVQAINTAGGTRLVAGSGGSSQYVNCSPFLLHAGGAPQPFSESTASLGPNDTFFVPLTQSLAMNVDLTGWFSALYSAANAPIGTTTSTTDSSTTFASPVPSFSMATVTTMSTQSISNSPVVTTSQSTTTTVSPTPEPTPAPSLNAGIIAGSVVGGVAGLAIIVAVVSILWRWASRPRTEPVPVLSQVGQPGTTAFPGSPYSPNKFRGSGNERQSWM